MSNKIYEFDAVIKKVSTSSKISYIICIFVVMGQVNNPNLSESERTALESGVRSGSSHCFRMRCRSILLKAEGRTFKRCWQRNRVEPYHGWVKRFKQAGISGLTTKPRQGRKPKLDGQDKECLLAVVKLHCQQLSTAKADGKQVVENQPATVRCAVF